MFSSFFFENFFSNLEESLLFCFLPKGLYFAKVNELLLMIEEIRLCLSVVFEKKKKKNSKISLFQNRKS